MSFMFNPYPYDDPTAVNHIEFDKNLRNTITNNSIESAKKIVSEIKQKLKDSPCCVIGLEGYISAPVSQFVGLISIQCAQNDINVRSISRSVPDDTLYKLYICLKTGIPTYYCSIL